MTVYDQLCWFRLKIDTADALLPSYELPRADQNPKLIFSHHDPDIMFTAGFLTEMQQLGLPIRRGLLWYRPANYQTETVHIDLKPDTSAFVYSINWVIGGENSRMGWWAVDDPEQMPIKYIDERSPYCEGPRYQELREADMCEIDHRPVLVRTDFPHTIIMGDRPRWCIAARIARPAADWNEIADYAVSCGLAESR
jgi:hypothetical protein